MHRVATILSLALVLSQIGCASTRSNRTTGDAPAVQAVPMPGGVGVAVDAATPNFWGAVVDALTPRLTFQELVIYGAAAYGIGTYADRQGFFGRHSRSEPAPTVAPSSPVGRDNNILTIPGSGNTIIISPYTGAQ